MGNARLGCCLVSFAVMLGACGRKNVTYDLTIENPYADVQGVTATLITEGGASKDVPVSGAKSMVSVDLPEIKKGDAMRQRLNVTLHAPLSCGKVDLPLDTKWADVADDLARMEKSQHPTVSANVLPDTPPKRCDKP